MDKSIPTPCFSSAPLHERETIASIAAVVCAEAVRIFKLPHEAARPFAPHVAEGVARFVHDALIASLSDEEVIALAEKLLRPIAAPDGTTLQ